MSDLPEGTFQPQSGKLGQTVFKSPGDSAPELRFFVEISFRPFDWDDESQSPLLRIDNLTAPVKSWTELAERSFEFRYAPNPGSVEAAVLMFGCHNPADVTGIEFGAIEDGRLPCRFETEVDFEMEAGREDLEQVEMAFDLLLQVEPLRVSTSLEKQCDGDPDAIREIVGQAVDFSQYGEIEKVSGGYVFPPLT